MEQFKFAKSHRMLEGGRNFLHVNHEQAFKEFVIRQRGFTFTANHPKKSAFEAFRIRRPEGDGWFIVHRREGAQHFTVPIGIEDLVRRFVAEYQSGKKEKLMAYKLIDKDGNEKKPGDEITDFRGKKWTLLGFTLPKNAASSGRVNVRDEQYTRDFYPNVFGLKILEE